MGAGVELENVDRSAGGDGRVCWTFFDVWSKKLGK